MSHTLRTLKKIKEEKQKKVQMLTCYDYQTAQLLNQTELDLILVGDSLGNVILGHETTIPVTLEEMKIFGRAVTRGAPEKFVIVDLPFGSYSHWQKGVEAGIELFQATNAQAVKLEGAAPHCLEIIKSLVENGVPVMGHIGLTPQSVHQMGGYFTHGKEEESRERLKKQAYDLAQAGCFSLVLECVESKLSAEITRSIPILTIGIGSGEETDGQVLVLNDLLGLGPNKPPGFCRPIANLFETKKELINAYLKQK